MMMCTDLLTVSAIMFYYRLLLSFYADEQLQLDIFEYSEFAEF